MTLANTIVLQQHWYGSAPLGQAASRGFQTIARSRSLAQDAELESHCVYRRPTLASPARPAPARREGPWPVNWGWFALDRDRVLLHRIGYAGTDEGGRPGNFLAHNLIACRAELEQIDFDVPALFRWVSLLSPFRYPLDVGGSDGFPHNYRQLYALHGQDRQKLQNIAPLEIPVADLLQMRQEMDAGAREGHREVLPDLLRCLLCTPDQRRVILMAGLSQGEEDSAREQGLLELLFGLLPFPCRETLTYSTYESEPAGLLAPPRAGTAPPAFRQRRLHLVPAGVDLGFPNNPRLWLLHLGTSQVLAPPASFLAEELAAAVQSGAWEQLFAWREACGAFTSAAGLTPLEALWRLTRTERKRAAGDLADAWSMPLPTRPGRPQVRDLVGALLPAAEAGSGSASEDRTRLGLRYLELLRLTPPPELVDGIPVTKALAYLCRWSLQEGQSPLFTGLLEVLSDPPACPELSERIAASLALVPPALDSIEQFHSLVNCWIDQIRKPSGEQAKLLAGVGATLLRMLLSAQDELARQARPEALLALIQRGRVTESADLGRSLDLLREVLRGHDFVSRVGKVLASALRDGRVPTQLVEELTVRDPLALLRFHALWLVLAREEVQADLGLEERLRSPVLLDAFANLPIFPMNTPARVFNCWSTSSCRNSTRNSGARPSPGTRAMAQPC